MLNGFGLALSGPARGGVGSGSACAELVQAPSAASTAPASTILSPEFFIVGPSSSATSPTSTVGRANSSWEAAFASKFGQAKAWFRHAVVAMQHRLLAPWAHRCPIGRHALYLCRLGERSVPVEQGPGEGSADDA